LINKWLSLGLIVSILTHLGGQVQHNPNNPINFEYQFQSSPTWESRCNTVVLLVFQLFKTVSILTHLGGQVQLVSLQGYALVDCFNPHPPGRAGATTIPAGSIRVYAVSILTHLGGQVQPPH